MVLLVSQDRRHLFVTPREGGGGQTNFFYRHLKAVIDCTTLIPSDLFEYLRIIKVFYRFLLLFPKNFLVFVTYDKNNIFVHTVATNLY
jgi:hypothetical protein